jgi:lysylphosphatidylglycerol synthetase-like protein (DUF2156 family)
MDKKWLIAIVPGVLALVLGVLALVLGVFIVALFLVKILWAWTIPDLFPGAVDQGLIAKEISWYTSLKVAIFVAALAGIAGIRQGEKS